MKPLKLGFLGLGWIGKKRMESILGSGIAAAAAVADCDPELTAAAAALAPGAIQCRDIEEMLELNLDGLVIATPSAQHAEQTILALERGLPVFCQKPLGRNALEVKSIIETAQRANRLLGVDLSYRYVTGIRMMRDLVSSGKLGKVFAADLTFHNAYGPQKPWFYNRKLAGGGCVVDLGIHLVDTALWTLGSDVRSVTSRVFAKGEPLTASSEEVEDYASARIELESGCIVNLTCSWHIHAGCDAVIEAAFYGTEGGAATRNVRGSFTEFTTSYFRGTASDTIASPPDAWEGRAAIAWAQQLQANAGYSPEIERQIQVAEILDQIYKQA